VKELFTKPQLTVADQRKLKEIKVKINKLATGQAAQAVKEWEVIHKTLDLVMKERGPS
jgi:hypothetical protein